MQPEIQNKFRLEGIEPPCTRMSGKGQCLFHIPRKRACEGSSGDGTHWIGTPNRCPSETAGELTIPAYTVPESCRNLDWKTLLDTGGACRPCDSLHKCLLIRRLNTSAPQTVTELSSGTSRVLRSPCVKNDFHKQGMDPRPLRDRETTASLADA